MMARLRIRGFWVTPAAFSVAALAVAVAEKSLEVKARGVDRGVKDEAKGRRRRTRRLWDKCMTGKKKVVESL